jgi:hypothetical protein
MFLGNRRKAALALGTARSFDYAQDDGKERRPIKLRLLMSDFVMQGLEARGHLKNLPILHPLRRVRG